VHQCRRYRVFADKGGWYGLDPAFDYKGLQMEVSQAMGSQEWKSHVFIGEKNQFALEMDHMSQCVMNNQQPFTPGEEGLQDQRIIEALYRSVQEGKMVALEKHSGPDIFRGTQPTEK